MYAARRKSYGYLAFMAMIAVCIGFGVGSAECPAPVTPMTSTSNNEAQNASATIGVTSNTLTYENPTFGFKMNYSPDWTMHEPGPNDMHLVVGFLAPGEDVNNPIDYVLVQVENLSAKPAITLDQYAQAVADNLKRSYPDFNLILSKDTKISGFPGKELSYTMSSGQSSYHNILAFTIKDNKAYSITLDSLTERFSDMEGSASEMINSFEFKSSSPSLGSTIGAPLMSN